MRWLWSIGHFPLTRIVVGAAIVIAVPVAGALLLDSAYKARVGGKIPPLVLLVPILLLAHLAYVGYVWLFERRPVCELSFSKAPAELLGGASLGGLLAGLVVGLLAILGYDRVLGVNSLAVIVPALALAAQSAYLEELVARGILFRILEEWLGTWLALTISAAIFGGLHLLNRNATVIAALAIALSAGLLLGAAFVVTRRLWMPIGLHFAWNASLGAVLGLAVSGGEAKGLLRSELAGPELLTGGPFGPEASIQVMILGLVFATALLVRAKRQGRVIPPVWRRAKEAAPAEIPSDVPFESPEKEIQ